MGYMIFNVRTRSFLCVRIDTRRLGIPTTSQHIFDTEKLSQIFRVHVTGFGPSFSHCVPQSLDPLCPSQFHQFIIHPIHYFLPFPQITEELDY